MSIYHNEINKECCRVLRRHFTDTLVDERSITDVTADELREYGQCHFFAGIGGFSAGFRGANVSADVNVWTAGFPCQDLSVAGKRKGLAGERSGLYFEFHRLITGHQPRWVVLENVPGLLSSNGGRDFAIVVGGLTGIIPSVPEGGWGNAGFFRGAIYSVAYRVLDAQFFGVAQRRRRVFIVGSLGSGRCAKVLFESEGVCGDSTTGRKARPNVAFSTEKRINEVSPTLHTGLGHHGWSIGDQDWNMLQPVGTMKSNGDAHSGFEFGDGLIACNNFGEREVSTSLSSKNQRINGDTETFVLAVQADATPKFGDIAFTLKQPSPSGGGQPAAVLAWHENKSGQLTPSDTAKALRSGASHSYQGVGVRRLTPTECERLQGFPDGWTSGESDSTRYRMLGNAVCVPVTEWVGRRIMEAA